MSLSRVRALPPAVWLALAATLAGCPEPDDPPAGDDDGADDDTADDDTGDDDGADDDGGAPPSATPGPGELPCIDDPPEAGDPLAALGECGVLVYGPYANRDQDHADNRLPDFSFAGYGGGGVALPQVPTVRTLQPEPGDDHERIQGALDEVAALAPDADGFRGAVLLAAGTYESSETLRIEASGVVLRGEGQGDDGTVIVATAAGPIALIEVVGGGGPDVVDGSERAITADHVPVGAHVVPVEDTDTFEPGDLVAVRRTPNDDWIDALGMEPYGWTADSYAIAHERTVVRVDHGEGTVELDIPLVDSIAAEHGGGRVERLEGGARIRDCGVEDLRLDSTHDGDEDEDHAWTGVLLRDVEHAWVQRVTALHFGSHAVSVEGATRFVTVQDCAMLDPVSQITGGRRYPFNVDEGLGVLFQRCYARDGRHSFVTGSRVTGPHVWLDCLAEQCHADDGPHHRWATGLLFDNTRSAELRVQNRQDSGSGHGWAGAQVLFWNGVVTDHFVSDAPPAAMNWVVGLVGDEGEGQWAPEEPPGIQESLGTPVTPRSLYLQQLADRLGEAAVEAVTVPEQRQGPIWEPLSAWAGEGAPDWTP